MKKLILIAVAALFSINSSAQLISNNHLFQLGDYSMFCENKDKMLYKCGGDFTFECKNKREFDNFVQFVTENEERIKEEFKVYFKIKEISKRYSMSIITYYIVMEVYDVKSYDEYMESIWADNKYKRAEEEKKRQKRMDNLNAIFQ